MRIEFQKYQGAGNDFIILDERDVAHGLNKEQIAFLCHRRFGIGADGLMLLARSPEADFRMVYYNADGEESTMCGNGGRCIARYAQAMGWAGDSMEFLAIDGPHKAEILNDGRVALHMRDVDAIEWHEDHAVLDTGSPHFVQWTENGKLLDVVALGRQIRNRADYAPNGINVNFADIGTAPLAIRTYERGVEDETLACGTGAVAVAIASTKESIGDFNIDLKAVGGLLNVKFSKKDAVSAHNIVLTGEAQKVFEGVIVL